MAQQIPGVPEGWELVRIGGDITAEVDWLLSSRGLPILCSVSDSVNQNYIIIRKIEKPARYRPFRDAEEYLPHWGKPIRFKGGIGFDTVVSTSRLGVYVASETMITQHTMPDAFKRFEFADGTPFGVRIDE
jgi:hypothetical protein